MENVIDGNGSESNRQQAVKRLRAQPKESKSSPAKRLKS